MGENTLAVVLIVMAQFFILERDSGRCFRQLVSLIVNQTQYNGLVRARVRGSKNETDFDFLKNLSFWGWMRTDSISVWLEATREETGNGALVGHRDNRFVFEISDERRASCR